MKLSRATKRVEKILRVVPYNMNAAALEALRSLKQELVELDTRAGAIRSMLLDVLDDEEDIRDMLISKVRDVNFSRQHLSHQNLDVGLPSSVDVGGYVCVLRH